VGSAGRGTIQGRVSLLLTQWGQRTGGDYRTMAEAFGHRSPSLANKWWNGTSTPDRDALVRLVELTGANGHWVMTGEGDPWTLPGAADAKIEAIRRYLTGDAGALPDAGGDSGTAVRGVRPTVPPTGGGPGGGETLPDAG
jgi:hypothetical protein